MDEFVAEQDMIGNVGLRPKTYGRIDPRAGLEIVVEVVADPEERFDIHAQSTCCHVLNLLLRLASDKADHLDRVGILSLCALEEPLESRRGIGLLGWCTDLLELCLGAG